jgi:hypothetical protein
MREQIRQLYFQDRLSYKEIRKRTGVGFAAINTALEDGDDFDVQPVGQCSACPLRLFTESERETGRCDNCLQPGYLQRSE